MDDAREAFEAAIWAAAEGRASDEQRALLDAAPEEHLRLLERLIDDVDDMLTLTGLRLIHIRNLD